MAGLEWRTPPSEAWPKGAEAYVRSVRAGIHGVCQRWAAQLTNEMKDNAPWTDRSGAARQSLRAEVEPPTADQIQAMVELVLAHGVEYGVYLELKNAGAFAIINPTLDAAAPRIWADIRRLFT